MGKAFYRSRTFWVNVLAIAALLLQSFTGFDLSAEAQVSILAAINILLRAITKEPLNWGSQAGRADTPLVLHLLLAVVGIVMLTGTLSGCSIRQPSQASLAAKSLLSAQAVVVGVAESADYMCAAGTLSQTQCDTMAGLYARARTSYDVAAELLIVAIDSGGSEESAAWANYRAVSARFSDIASSMQAFATQFGITPVPDAEQ